MSNFPKTLERGVLMTEALTREIEHRYNKYKDLEQQLAEAGEREKTNDTLLEQQGDKLAALHDLLAELREHILSAHVHLSYRQGTWHGVPMEYADKAQSQLEQALAVMEPKTTPDLIVDVMQKALAHAKANLDNYKKV